MLRYSKTIIAFSFGLFCTESFSQNSPDWRTCLAKFNLCEPHQVLEFVDSIFVFNKTYLVSNIDTIKSEVYQELEDCDKTKVDSLMKRAQMFFFQRQYNLLPYSLSKKHDLTVEILKSRNLDPDNMTALDSSQLTTIYQYLGNSFRRLGQFEKALSTYSKGLMYSSQSDSLKNFRNVMSARFYKLRQQIDQNPMASNIIELYALRKDFYSVYGDHPVYGPYFSALLDLFSAKHFIAFNQKDSADHYFKKIPNTYSVFDIDSNRDIAYSLYFKKFKEWQNYETNLKRRIQHKLQFDGNPYKEEILLAQHYLQFENISKAKNLFNAVKSKGSNKNKDLIVLHDELAYAQALLGLAEISLLENKGADALAKIWEVRNTIINKLSYSDFQKDKIALMETFSQVARLVFSYQETLSLSNEDLLLFIEQSKSLALFDEIRTNAILKNDLGNSNYYKYQAFQDSVFNAKKRLLDVQMAASERIEIEKSKFVFEDSIQALRSLSNHSDFSDIDILDLIAKYPKCTIVQYYTTDSIAYVFVINDGQTNSIQLEYTDETKNSIDIFNSLVRNRRSSIDQIDSLAQEIYNVFVKPIVSSFKKDILIIPYGKISAIPFECLRGQDNTYLVQKHNISYAFSLGVNDEMIKKGRKENRFLGFAPSYTSSLVDYTFETLDENVQELAFVSNFYSNALTFQDLEATKSKFKTHIRNADIIHISAHADIHPFDNDFSYIAFCDKSSVTDSSLLYLSELYNIELNAEMIVLSACNTSAGTYKEGEGIMSLARGFTYAGASSIVSTLWKVNESSTREIISDFYVHLKKGQTKVSALAEAKRLYLEKNLGRDLHPYFWSGIILIGNKEPLVQKKIPYIFLLCLSIPIIYLLFFRNGLSQEAYE